MYVICVTLWSISICLNLQCLQILQLYTIVYITKYVAALLHTRHSWDMYNQVYRLIGCTHFRGVELYCKAYIVTFLIVHNRGVPTFQGDKLEMIKTIMYHSGHYCISYYNKQIIALLTCGSASVSFTLV